MFSNLGGAEILVIAVVVLIAVGPEQLPSVLRKGGRLLAQARSMTSGLRDEFMSGIEDVSDAADPKTWMGSGTEDDPVVPRGYAQKDGKAAGDGSFADGLPAKETSSWQESAAVGTRATPAEPGSPVGDATLGSDAVPDGRASNETAPLDDGADRGPTADESAADADSGLNDPAAPALRPSPDPTGPSEPDSAPVESGEGRG